MATPLRRALEAYVARNPARFHMPGHKGRLPAPLAEAAPFDVTEVPGTDSLYEASEAIAGTERAFSALYGTAGSFLSAGGATLCLQAMLALAVPPGGKVLCGRGLHTAAVSTMALLDLAPVWLYPEPGAEGLMGAISPATVAKALRDHPDAVAVYVTSPSYYGVMCDVEALSALCGGKGIPLLVDNAHGAHLKFLPASRHPMDLGAALCADSLHKTLPALTGGALLHCGDPAFLADAKGRMALFGSTSPSYLILLSCDMALDYLRGPARADLARVCRRLEALRDRAADWGYELPGRQGDPLRLTLGFAPLGYGREDFGAYVRARGAEPEYLGEAHCVFLAGPLTTEAELDVLEKLLPCPKGEPLPGAAVPLPRPAAVMSVREAAFAPREAVEAGAAAGRTAAALVAPCPPGIPVVMPGEKITGDMARLLKSYGISRVNVVK